MVGSQGKHGHHQPNTGYGHNLDAMYIHSTSSWSWT